MRRLSRLAFNAVSFKQKKQSICTSKFIKIFEYNTCNCPAECRKGSLKLR